MKILGTALVKANRTGWYDAWHQHKLAAPAPTSPIVKNSPVLSNAAADPHLDPVAAQKLQPPTSPAMISQVFNQQEQGRTRLEPPRKVAAEEEQKICTSCRGGRHYGPCPKPTRTRPEGKPVKQANFNLGLQGNDPKFVGSSEDGPSTSPGYHSATSDSSLARARDGRPADEQAATGFADLFRHLGVTSIADEPGQMTGGLIKQQSYSGVEGHSLYEHRGPTVNPYEERLTIKSPPVAWGPEGPQAIQHAFDQIDGAVDSTGLEGATGSQPASGPSVLG